MMHVNRISERLVNFTDEVEGENIVYIEENDYKENFQMYSSSKELLKTFFVETTEKTGIIVSEEDKPIIELSGARFVWTNENFDELDYLYGSAMVCGISTALWAPTNFWKVYIDSPSNEKEKEFLENLACIQRSAHGDDGTFGCLHRKPPNYPCDLYFFDNGVYSLLDLTLVEYFDAMIESKAVVLWQYFYLEPRAIVEMLKGLRCDNWISLYNDLEGNPTRLEGLIIHMERVIEQFPVLFPDHDLTFFQSKLDGLVNYINSSQN